MNEAIIALILSIAPTNDEAATLLAIAEVESAGNPRAVSPVGARGLFQIMPITHRDVTGRIDKSIPEGDLFDPTHNAKVGRAYWRWIRGTETGANFTDALVCWNWGFGNCRAWKRGGGRMTDLPTETARFIEKVTEARQRWASEARVLRSNGV